MKNASGLMLLVILIAAQLVQTPVAFAIAPARRSIEAYSPHAASSLAAFSCGSPYIVKSGDTLSSIAARCGTSIYSLQQANGIQGTIIRVGQQLYRARQRHHQHFRPRSGAGSSDRLPQSIHRPLRRYPIWHRQSLRNHSDQPAPVEPVEFNRPVHRPAPGYRRLERCPVRQ